MSKRLTIKQFAEAYKIMKARGWTPVAEEYCNKADMKVCPIAALALTTRVGLPPEIENYNFRQRVVFHFGVSLEYVDGIVCGVDDPLKDASSYSVDFRAGYALGQKLNARFIAAPRQKAKK